VGEDRGWSLLNPERRGGDSIWAQCAVDLCYSLFFFPLDRATFEPFSCCQRVRKSVARGDVLFPIGPDINRHWKFADDVFFPAQERKEAKRTLGIRVVSLHSYPWGISLLCLA